VTTASPSPTTDEHLPEVVRYLIAAGQAAPSADNSQPWCFRWYDGVLSLSFRPQEAAAKVFGEDRHCEHLTMGVVCENLVQAAQAAGLTVDWTFNPGGPDYLSAAINAETSVTDALKRHSLFDRHTNRLAYQRQPIDRATLMSVAALREADCRLVIMPEPQRIARVSQVVEAASRLRFRTREIHEWFGSVLRFSAKEVAAGDGLDVATIDLPPGGRLLLRLIQDWRRMALLNRIGFYKLFARIEAAKVKNSAAIIAVVGPSGAASEVAAGRLMERAWILLNANGIAVQPFYVVTDLLRRLEADRTPPELMSDALDLRRRLTALLPGEGHLHMFLRAGLPKQEPVRARRLPLSSAYTTMPPTTTPSETAQPRRRR